MKSAHPRAPRHNEPSPNPDGPFSAEVCIKPRQTSRYCQLLHNYAPHKDTGDFIGWGLFQRQQSGTGQTGNGFQFLIYDNQGDQSSLTAEVHTPLDTSKWYHLAGVYDGSKIELYVNGSKVATTGIPAGRRFSPNSWAGLILGGRNGWYLGDLDEPAIYGYALTAAQVQAHYQAGINPARPQPYRQTILADQPLGYWPFDDAP